MDARITNTDQPIDFTEDRKHEVLAWLDNVFDGEEIHISASEDELIELYKTMIRNKQVDDLYTKNLKLMEHLILEYDAEANKMEQVLAEISFLPESFSRSGQLSVKTLADIASMLQLNDTSLSSFGLGISKLQFKLEKLKASIQSEDEEALELEQATQSVLKTCAELRRLQETFDRHAVTQSSVVEKKSKETSFLQAKSRQYEKDHSRLQATLLEHGLVPNLCHESLLQQNEERRQLLEELEPLQAKLNAYHSLPPDIPLAKVKVELARRELGELDAQLCEDIDNLKL